MLDIFIAVKIGIMGRVTRENLGRAINQLKNLSAAAATIVVVPAAELQVFVFIGIRPADRDARGGVVRGGREVVGHEVVDLVAVDDELRKGAFT